MVANIAQAVRTRLAETDVRLTAEQADVLCEFIRAEAIEARD
ncbi:hypothetical protein [Microbacterium sp. HD4P20]|nr:hypothetical protein [Microbacterium sp. HD4P20]